MSFFDVAKRNGLFKIVVIVGTGEGICFRKVVSFKDKSSGEEGFCKPSNSTE